MDKINNLLQQVSIIQRKYDEIAKITGENFNVFSVLKMDSKEVRMHSAFIGELINPNGSHGQGSIFLNLFVELINESFNSDEDKIELNHFGKLVNDKICERTISVENNWDDVTGGRIDLIIEDDKQIVIIENKIYAIDQPYQLIRYKNYTQTKSFKNAFLFYLTLDGKDLKKHEDAYIQNKIEIIGSNFKYDQKNEYDKFKIENEGKDNIHHCLYYPISFEIHIRDWIEKCLEKTHSLPIIRETLVQYLHLIKKLTNQTTNNKMSKDIVERMEKEIQASFEVANNLSELKKKLYDDFIKTLKETKEFDIKDTDHSDYYGVDIRCKDFEKNPIRLLFGKTKDMYKELCNSVSCGYQIDDFKITESLEQKYNSIGFEVNSAWIYKWIKSGKWSNSPEIWEEIAKGKEGKVYQEIISVIKEIIEIEKISN
jgi:muramidase (phage lysozyme)